MKRVRLGEVCTPARSSIAQKDLVGREGDHPIYGASGLIGKVDFYQQERPYVAVVKDGAGVGRIFRLPAKSAVIGTLQPLLPNADIAVDYLAYALEWLNLGRLCSGATIPHIYFRDYGKMEITLPSLSEQRHIAAVLDKIDSLIANYRRQLALLDTLAQSRFHELFGDMVTNSKQWPIRKLSDIAEYYNGLNYKPIDVSLEGTVVLRAGNIQNQALVLDDTVRVKIPIKERYLVKENDILMCACNGSIQLVGKSAIIPRLPEPMYFGSFMKIIRTPYPEYVQAFFQTLAFRRQIQTAKTTTINQITNQMMNLIELPFPPLSLIEDFNRQTTKLKAQKESIRTSLRVAETLKASMTQKFFK